LIGLVRNVHVWQLGSAAHAEQHVAASETLGVLIVSQSLMNVPFWKTGVQVGRYVSAEPKRRSMLQHANSAAPSSDPI
jgi:hypothetical protein